jgi:hypothetical protein
MENVIVPIAITAILFGALPATVFNFILRMKRLKVEEREAVEKTEQMRLEVEREKLRLAITDLERE